MNLFQQKQKKKIKKNGFTLLEMMVVIFVVTVGLIAVFSVIQRTVMLTTISVDRLIRAAYLAQEGLELVRNKRDSNWLELGSGDWAMGLPSGTESVNKFDRTTNISVMGDKMEVEVIVSWEYQGRDYEFSAQQHLYNWYPR